MSENVFLDLGFEEEEAAGLKLKSLLFILLQESIKSKGLTQAEIAKKIGTDQPKVSKIVNGRLGEFSIERIASFLQKLGNDIVIGAIPHKEEDSIGSVVLDDRAVRTMRSRGVFGWRAHNAVLQQGYDDVYQKKAS